MVKLTPELIEQAAQYTNPCRDRELDLRGYKIPVIENLGATLDQFDTIDLSDNDVRKLDGFPLLKRLKHILLNNNRIVRIGEGVEECIPHIESLILTNNGLQELGDIDYLTGWKNLTSLSLMRNPITTKKNYRLYVIHRIPQVRLLDFRKVKQKEREAAAAMFKGKKGAQLAKDLGKRTKTFTPGAPVAGEDKTKKATGPTDADIDAIRVAIANARSLEEVERLNQMLLAGHIPGRNLTKNGKPNGDEKEMEEEDEADDGGGDELEDMEALDT